jgi:hypothetical protein
MDMHRSRLAGFIIDCEGADPDAAATFWGRALGMAPQPREGEYTRLDAGSRDLHIEVQRVAHESRVHLDIEADDIPAEVARLERLGARRDEQTHAGSWVVMIAPTGQRFCVVRAKRDLSDAPGASVWDEA